VAVDNVAVPVRFPAFDQRKIAGNGLFKDVVLTGKLTYLFPGGHGRAIAGAFILREYAPGVGIDEIVSKTAGKIIVADDVREMRFS
jgi:hypothetical protein